MMPTSSGPNSRMDLTVTVAAQRGLLPRCLLVVPAAHAHVGPVRSALIAPTSPSPGTEEIQQPTRK